MTAAAPAREACPERMPGPGLLLDRVTGRVTMYRLVVLVLLAIAVVAVALSLLGVVPFPPLGLIAALVVAVAVGYGTNRLFAAIRRIRPHAESGVITGCSGSSCSSRCCPSRRSAPSRWRSPSRTSRSTCSWSAVAIW